MTKRLRDLKITAQELISILGSVFEEAIGMLHWPEETFILILPACNEIEWDAVVWTE